MKTQLVFHDKPIDIEVSGAAISQSEKLTNSRLIIEIQIYFSCLLGKRLALYSEQAMPGTWQVEPEQFSSMINEAQHLTGNVFVRFNTVMTKYCPASDYVGPPPVTDFEIHNHKPYVPSWLNIDFRDGVWNGQYGWPASDRRFANTKQVRAAAVVNKPSRDQQEDQWGPQVAQSVTTQNT